MDDLPNDCSRIEFHDDYTKCGQFGFSNKLLDGVQLPMQDYPSFKWLGVTELHQTDKYINKVAFKQCLAKVPSCKEDTSGAAFEDWIYKFSESKRSELYIAFPH